MYMISSPFIRSVGNAHSDVQLELNDMESDAILEEDFKFGPLLGFCSSLKDNFPKMRRQSQKMLLLSCSFFICI